VLRNKAILGLLMFLFILPGLAWGAPSESENEAQDSQSATMFLPIAGDNAEGDLMFGGMLIHSTVSSQTKMPLFFSDSAYDLGLDLEKYFNSGQNLLTVKAASKDWPDEFFGVGRRNLLEDAEIYTTIESKLELSYLWKHSKGFYVGPAVIWQRLEVSDQERGGWLDTAMLYGENKTTVIGSGIHLLWDTRDSDTFSSKGNFFEALAYVYDDALGSDCDFSQVNLDYRHFYEIAPRHVLGLQGLMVWSDGDVPFQMQPTLGTDSLMRGFKKRYRDDNCLVFQGEYRFPISRRFSGTVFAGVGEVFSKENDLRFDELMYSGGMGLRFTLIEKAKLNLRLDIAVGESDKQLFIGYGEAF
jgi:hypothetical protein